MLIATHHTATPADVQGVCDAITGRLAAPVGRVDGIAATLGRPLARLG